MLIFSDQFDSQLQDLWSCRMRSGVFKYSLDNMRCRYSEGEPTFYLQVLPSDLFDNMAFYNFKADFVNNADGATLAPAGQAISLATTNGRWDNSILCAC